MADSMESCPGCGGSFRPIDGPVHAYMHGSPACWRAFGEVLAAEYGDPKLMDVHRLSVDTYAVQHPGDGADRRAVQSVGLHLARLMLQLENPRPPKETNAVMLGLASHKASLTRLAPPDRFTMTVADVWPLAGSRDHAARVREWARATWADWSAHHPYIRSWVTQIA